LFNYAITNIAFKYCAAPTEIQTFEKIWNFFRAPDPMNKICTRFPCNNEK